MEDVRIGNLSQEHIDGIAKSKPVSRPQISTVVFDVGGVLACDGMPSTGIDQCFGPVFGEDGFDKHVLAEKSAELWKQVKVGDINSDRFYEELLNAANLDVSKAQKIHEEHMRYMTRWIESNRHNRIFKMLQKIHLSGYRLGVISNHVAEWLRPMFVLLGYDTFFPNDSQDAASVVIISDEVKLAKPNLEIYEAFLDALYKKIGSNDSDVRANLGKSCLFIDNKIKNVKAAEQAGFHGLHYEAIKSSEEELECMLAAAGVFLDPEE